MTDRNPQAGDEGLRLASAQEGYIPMSDQIVDASLVPAPKHRNTDGERDAIKAGKLADEVWPDELAKAAQQDTDARWILKIGGKVRYRPDGTPLPMSAPIAITR
jgi:IS5 family transposase